MGNVATQAYLFKTKGKNEDKMLMKMIVQVVEDN